MRAMTPWGLNWRRSIFLSASGCRDGKTGHSGQDRCLMDREVRVYVDLHWRKVAAKTGVPGSEIDRMASAFVHEDLQAALSRPAPPKGSRDDGVHYA